MTATISDSPPRALGKAAPGLRSAADEVMHGRAAEQKVVRDLLPRPMTSTVLSFREGICFSPLTAPIEPRQVIARLYMAFPEFPVRRPRMAH